MVTRNRKCTTIIICIIALSICAIAIAILFHLGIFSKSEAQEPTGSNLLEHWQSEPVAYGHLSPPRNHSIQNDILQESTAYDVVIVGAGISGLSAALKLCEENLQVLVVEANVRQIVRDDIKIRNRLI